MDIKEAIKKLESSGIFKKFKEKNSGYYLVHAFTMVIGDQQDWQIGYYGKTSDKVVVFDVGRKITQAPEQEVLKQKKTINKLLISKVKLDAKAALKLAEKANTAHETVTKRILILQNLENKQVYNITLVTTNFNIITVRVNAENGQVLKETKQSIMSLGQRVE
ncbi:PepSY domain-containing protein [Nanoarchaeota archaeon]